MGTVMDLPIHARLELVVLTRIVVDIGEASVVELELSRFPRPHGGFSCPTLTPG